MLIDSSEISSQTALSSNADSVVAKTDPLFDFFSYVSEEKKNLHLSDFRKNIQPLYFALLTQAFQNLLSTVITPIPNDTKKKFSFTDVSADIVAEYEKYLETISVMPFEMLLQEFLKLLGQARDSVSKVMLTPHSSRSNEFRTHMKERITFKNLLLFILQKILTLTSLCNHCVDPVKILALTQIVREISKEWISKLKKMGLFQVGASAEQKVYDDARVTLNLVEAVCHFCLGNDDLAEVLLLGCLDDLPWFEEPNSTARILAEYVYKSYLARIFARSNRLEKAQELCADLMQKDALSKIEDNDKLGYLYLLLETSQSIADGHRNNHCILASIEQDYQSLDLLEKSLSTLKVLELEGKLLKIPAKCFEAGNFLRAQIIDCYRLHGGAEELLAKLKLMEYPKDIFVDFAFNEELGRLEIQFTGVECCEYFAGIAREKTHANWIQNETKLCVSLDDHLQVQDLYTLFGKENCSAWHKIHEKFLAVAVANAIPSAPISVSKAPSPVTQIPTGKAAAEPKRKRSSKAKTTTKKTKVPAAITQKERTLVWEWTDEFGAHTVHYVPHSSKSSASLFGHWYGYIPAKPASGILNAEERQSADKVLKGGVIVGVHGKGIKRATKETKKVFDFKIKPPGTLRIFGHPVSTTATVEGTAEKVPAILYSFDTVRQKH